MAMASEENFYCSGSVSSARAYHNYRSGNLWLVGVDLERRHEVQQGGSSDFEWFASGNADSSKFKGRYVAVYNKQVIGWGETSKEAYDMAKKAEPHAEPALAYIPENEDSVF
jgi:hypothetical protein